MFRALIFGFVDFLFPKSEAVYRLESLSPSELLHKLPPGKDLGEDTIAVFNYTDERVRNLIWELKYRKNMKIAESLALILFDILKSELAERALFESASWRITNPLLVPIPMSFKRLRERGSNQTEVLCEEIKKLDTENLLTYSASALTKLRHTESQTLTENKKERLRNMEGSMAATEAVRGRNIILLDDVTTTGATFRDARRALRESGAKKIICIALAH